LSGPLNEVHAFVLIPRALNCNIAVAL